MKKENWLKLRDEVNTLSLEEVEAEIETMDDTIHLFGTNSKMFARWQLLTSRYEYLKRIEELQENGIEFYDNELWVTKIDLGYGKTPTEAYKKALSILKELKGVQIVDDGKASSQKLIKVYTKNKTYTYATHWHYSNIIVGQEEFPTLFGDRTYMRDIYEPVIIVGLIRV